MKLRPIASTRTSASPSFGDGSAMSSRRRTSGPPGAETRIAFMAGSLRRTGKSRPARVTCCDEVSRGEAHGHANRERHDGRDRGPGRPLLGRADAAFAPELRDRRDPVRAADDPRIRDPQESGGRREPRPRPPPAREGRAHRRRRGGSRRREARRALSSRRLPDRQRHADEHERERGDLEPRDRTGGRRPRLEGPDSPERRREQIAILERHVPDRDVDRGRLRDRGTAPSRSEETTRRPRCEVEGVRGRREDRPHAPAGRGPAHARSGDLRLGVAARPRNGTRPAGPASPPRARDRRHGRGHRAQHTSRVRCPGREACGRDDRASLRHGAEQVRGPRRARRARVRLRSPSHARRIAHEDRERRALARIGPAERNRRAPHPRERAGQLDHAGQGQPDAVRGADDGRRTGLRKRRGRGIRREPGQLRAPRLQARHDPQRARVDAPPRGRVPQRPPQLRRRAGGRPRADRRAREGIAHARHGPEPPHRVRQGRRHREEGAPGRPHAEGGRAEVRPRHVRAVRRVDRSLQDGGAWRNRLAPRKASRSRRPLESATMPYVRSEEAGPGRVYPWYVLAVLVLVYVLNFIDRQIVVILAERFKADLKVTDAQLGFLYGTVFAVFFAVFASGIFIGAGLGLGIGGLIVDRWDASFPAGAAPLGLHGWQAAFLVVGLPGLLLALWVRTLREPPRGGFGAPPVARHPHPFRLFLGEMSSVIPPFTLVTLARGGAGPAGLAINVGAASALVAAAAVLTRLLGTAPQWIALAVGLYSVFSWAQGLRLKSRGDFDLVFRNPPLVLSNIGFGLVTFGTYSTSLWIAPFFLRVHHLDIARVGLLLGGLLAAGGWLGATSGGLLAAAWPKKTPRGRLYVGVLTAALALPLGFILLSLRSPSAALLLSFPVAILTGLWIGPAASTVQELVPPRLRATASAVYILHTTFLGLALGPYAVGRLSVFTGDLKSALLLALPVQEVAAALLFLAARRIPRA